MKEKTKILSILTLGLILTPFVFSTDCLAQAAGSRGGISQGASDDVFKPLDPDEVNRYITVEGKAELRLKPTQIRIVLAVTSEDESSKGCSQKIKETVDGIKKSWVAIGIDESSINEDFIAVLPRYEWKILDRGGETVGVESKVGYRMQTNLHIAVPDERKSMEVLEKAYEAGVTDIIGFDYWSKEIDEGKVAALKKAIQKAREKADTLLVLFEENPPIINVQEQTRTYFPKGLYESFENTYASETYRPTRRDIPFIGAHRPKNTYYRGLDVESDARSTELPMRPEISIVSTFRIYYRSPAALDDKDNKGELKKE
jgi:uncharacterized protein YggE